MHDLLEYIHKKMATYYDNYKLYDDVNKRCEKFKLDDKVMIHLTKEKLSPRTFKI